MPALCVVESLRHVFLICIFSSTYLWQNFNCIAFYGYPTRSSKSLQYVRASVALLLCMYSSMKTIVVSGGWFLLAVCHYVIPTWKKDNKY